MQFIDGSKYFAVKIIGEKKAYIHPFQKKIRTVIKIYVGCGNEM